MQSCAAKSQVHDGTGEEREMQEGRLPITSARGGGVTIHRENSHA